MKKEDLKVAVLLPCYNDELTIEKVVKDFKKELPEATIYVCDNNSKDKSVSLAEKAGAVVMHEYKQGKGNVMRKMFREIEADIYLINDSDDTYPAHHAKEMVDMIKEGKADMVIGDRLSSTYFTENKRFGHNFGNRLVRFLINSLFKTNVRDIMTGYRAFTREFVKSFPVLSKGFAIETEMTIHAADKNFLIGTVLVDYQDRPEGSVSKLNTYSDGFRVLKTIAMLFRDYKPFSFFTIISLIFLIASLGFGIPVVIEYFSTGLVPRFPTLIVSGLFLTVAILLFVTGLILDVIVRKHKQLYELILTQNRNL